MKYKLADIIAGFFFLAIIYVLVRPRSKAAELLDNVTSAAVALVKTATNL